MKDLAKNLGLKIKQYRNAKHLKQSELAEMLEIDSKYLSRLETGISTPSFKTLEKLAEIFNIEVSALFEFDYIEDKETIIEKLEIKIKNYSTKQLNTLYKFTNVIDTNCL